MEKEQHRSVIRFLFLVGKTCEEIKVKLHTVYKDHAPSMTIIRYWFNEVKRGRTSVFDEERPGRPIEVTTEDNMVKKIHDIVLADRRVNIREIANIVDISTGKYPTRKIGLEKAIGEMDAAGSRSGAKTESHDNYGALLGHV